jgi:transposase-like protein
MKDNQKYIDKKWLEDQYAYQGKSVSKIANECGVAINTISRWLSYFSLRKKRNYQGNQKGQNNSFWKGGKYTDRLNGYVLVYNPDHPFAKKKGYVQEHRLVMEKSLGRYLRKNEIVHHRNKRKTDNRIENLELIVIGDVNGGDVTCPHCSKVFKLS